MVRSFVLMLALLTTQWTIAQTCHVPSQDEINDLVKQEPTLRDAIAVRTCLLNAYYRNSDRNSLYLRSSYTFYRPTSDRYGDVTIFDELLCSRSTDEPLQCDNIGNVGRLTNGRVINITHGIGSQKLVEILGLFEKLRGDRETIHSVFEVNDNESSWNPDREFSVIVNLADSPDKEEYFEYNIARECKGISSCAWRFNGPKPYDFPIILY